MKIFVRKAVLNINIFKVTVAVLILFANFTNGVWDYSARAHALEQSSNNLGTQCSPGTFPVIDSAGQVECENSDTGAPSFQNIGGYAGQIAEVGFGLENERQRTLPELLGLILKGALTVLGGIFLIIMVYGGYQWLLSRGSAEMVERGRKAVTNAIIGFIIVAAAYVITNFVSEILVRAVNTGMD